MNIQILEYINFSWNRYLEKKLTYKYIKEIENFQNFWYFVYNYQLLQVFFPFKRNLIFYDRLLQRPTPLDRSPIEVPSQTPRRNIADTVEGFLSAQWEPN